MSGVTCRLLVSVLVSDQMDKGLSQKFLVALVAGVIFLGILLASLFLLKKHGFELFDKGVEKLQELWKDIFEI